MRNPETNARGSITPLQISKQVPDLILRSFDDIQNTMYDMKKRGLLHEVEGSLLDKIQKDYKRVGTVESEKEETQFQISVDGIIQFRKSIRPIARLAINNEEKYQTIVDKTKGDPEVKAELKKVPEELKESLKGYSKIKAGLRNIPKKLMEKVENEAYDIVANKVVRLGANAGIFVTKLIFFKEDAGTDFGLQDWTL
jgi:seryl-tRNA synthetase